MKKDDLKTTAISIFFPVSHIFPVRDSEILFFTYFNEYLCNLTTTNP